MKCYTLSLLLLSFFAINSMNNTTPDHRSKKSNTISQLAKDPQNSPTSPHPKLKKTQSLPASTLPKPNSPIELVKKAHEQLSPKAINNADKRPEKLSSQTTNATSPLFAKKQ